MKSPQRVVIIRRDSDAALALSLLRILDDGLRDQVPRIRFVELSWGAREPAPVAFRETQPGLAILVAPEGEWETSKSCLASLRKNQESCPLLVVLPESLGSLATQLLETGASDFVIPPLRPWDLVSRVRHLLQRGDAPGGLVEQLKKAAVPKQIIGQNPQLLAQLRQLPLLAGCNATVLISGETGTGKELYARTIHYLSPRSGKAFVPVDCGAIPAELVENELFGHERGAYTSAPVAQTGLIQEAEGGTLLLDELDALSIPMQSKLLRFVQEREFRPLGSPKTRQADVRVIAATNVSLEQAVNEGRFRLDLFHRINILSVVMPALRDRPEDIPILARYFLETYAADLGRPARDFTQGALKLLVSHTWPGNARELENTVERAVLKCEGAWVDSCHLGLLSNELQNAPSSYQGRKKKMIAEWELTELRRLLTVYQGNVEAAARGEGKDAGAFRALLRKHHLRANHASPFWTLRP